MTKLSASHTKTLQRLERKIDLAETPIRWIDFYAAREAMYLCQDKVEREVDKQSAHQSAHRNEEQGVDSSAIVFDLVLVLSVAAGNGKHRLSIEELSGYESYFQFTTYESLVGYLTGDHVDAVFKTSVEPLQMSLDLNSATSSSEAMGPNVKEGSVHSELAPVLMIEQGYVYLRRFWQLQRDVNNWLDERVRAASLESFSSEGSHQASSQVSNKALASILSRLNSEDSSVVSDHQLDRQMLATAQSLICNTLLVSGGPGTGKTTTAAKILVANLYRRLCHESHEQGVHLEIACLAPTGKAAQRLAESLRLQANTLLGKLGLNDDDEAALRLNFPTEGKTIHRYLSEQGVALDDMGRRQRLSDNQRLFGSSEHQGHVPDIVLIDESSMIDLALMRALLHSFGPHTQSIFLGDPFQLPAIEPGAVFADWVKRCSAEGFAPKQLRALKSLLPEFSAQLDELAFDGKGRKGRNHGNDASEEIPICPLVQLTKSYRFGGALGDLAEAIKCGDDAGLYNLIRQKESKVVEFTDLRDKAADQTTASRLRALYQDYFDLISQGLQGSVDEQVACLQKAFDQAQLLCSTRQGPMGTEALNEQIEAMALAQFRQSAEGALGGHASTEHYIGRPVILEQNYSYLDLFNGDVGFMLETGVGTYSLAFYRGNHQPALLVPPSKVSNFRSAYAITVHKSQGSEYGSVAIVLADYAEELLTRALLYTAVTRSKSSLALIADFDQVLTSLKRER